MPEQIVASHLSGAHIGHVIRFVLTDRTQIEEVVTGKLLGLQTDHARAVVTLGSGSAEGCHREYHLPISTEVRVDAIYNDYKDVLPLRPTISQRLY